MSKLVIRSFVAAVLLSTLLPFCGYFGSNYLKTNLDNKNQNELYEVLVKSGEPNVDKDTLRMDSG